VIAPASEPADKRKRSRPSVREQAHTSRPGVRTLAIKLFIPDAAALIHGILWAKIARDF
jgi:hypothetical protein